MSEEIKRLEREAKQFFEHCRNEIFMNIEIYTGPDHNGNRHRILKMEDISLSKGMRELDYVLCKKFDSNEYEEYIANIRRKISSTRF